MQEEITSLTIFLIGSEGSGKSSLASYFTLDESQEKTIFRTLVTLRNIKYKLKVILFEKFHVQELEKMSHTDNIGLMFMYSIGDSMSFEIIKNMIRKNNSFIKKAKMPSIIVGNKCDTERTVSSKRGRKMAKILNTISLETSVHEKVNLEMAFYELISKMESMNRKKGSMCTIS